MEGRRACLNPMTQHIPGAKSKLHKITSNQTQNILRLSSPTGVINPLIFKLKSNNNSIGNIKYDNFSSKGHEVEIIPESPSQNGQ